MAYKDQNIAEVNTEAKIPKVFFSYNHKDKKVALKIKDRLKKAGIEVIIDKETMATGQNYAEFIKNCIKESVITLALISANSLTSTWVEMEINWSSYDESLRGRYFMPCSIDNSIFNPSFIDQALDILDGQIKEIDNTIQIRLQKRHGIEDLTEELTRIRNLRSELPSIIGRLKNSLCVNLSDEQFEAGIVKVIGDIKKTLNINALTEPTETKAKLPTEQHGNNQPQKAEQESKLDVADEINRGNILYKIADTMQLNITERCEIRIAKNTIPLIELSDGLEVDGVKIKENVKVSKDMEVKLIPSRNNAFNIVNITNQEQLLDDDSFTQWIFDVTPLITGNQLLTLVVSTITGNIHNKEIKKDVVFERIINVVTSDGELKRSHDMDHKEQIEQLILKGNLSSAISELLRCTKINGQKDLQKLLRKQSARFYHNENENNSGSVSHSDYLLTKNQITDAVSSIFDKYEPLQITGHNWKLYTAIGLFLVMFLIVLNIIIKPVPPGGPGISGSTNDKQVENTPKEDTNKVSTNIDAKKMVIPTEIEKPTVVQPEKKPTNGDTAMLKVESIVQDTNSTKNEDLPKVEIPKLTNDSTKIVGSQMVDIKFRVTEKYFHAKIFDNDEPAKIIDDLDYYFIIRVVLNKNHVFKLISKSGSSDIVERYVTTDTKEIMM